MYNLEHIFTSVPQPPQDLRFSLFGDTLSCTRCSRWFEDRKRSLVVRSRDRHEHQYQFYTLYDSNISVIYNVAWTHTERRGRVVNTHASY
jgi:hypothetical protein